MSDHPSSVTEEAKTQSYRGIPDGYEPRPLLPRIVSAAIARFRLLGSLAFIGALIGFAIASLRPLSYDSTATLMILQPKLGQTVAPTTASFRALLENVNLVSEVIQELRLDQPPFSLTPQVFLERSLSVEEVRNTNLVRLRVRLPSPEKARDVANAVAQKAVALNRRIDQEESLFIRDQIKEQLDRAAERLQVAEKDLLEFQQSAQLELVKKDSEAGLTQRGQLLSLSVDLAVEQARIARAEEELAKQAPTVTITRSIDDEPAMMESARQRASASPQGVLGLEMKSEFLNRTYLDLEQQLVLSRVRAAALERQIRQVESKGLAGQKLGVLNDLYEREMRLQRLKTEYDLAQRVYSELGLKYQQARVQVASNSAQLQVVDSALPSDRPVARQRLTFAALGGVLAVGLGMLSIIGRVLYAGAP
jgi:uncharacterized protein involved in exopolysaccharide biosynthesis